MKKMRILVLALLAAAFFASGVLAEEKKVDGKTVHEVETEKGDDPGRIQWRRRLPLYGQRISRGF